MSRIENNNGTVKTHIIGTVSLAVAVCLLIALPAAEPTCRHKMVSSTATIYLYLLTIGWITARSTGH